MQKAKDSSVFKEALRKTKNCDSSKTCDYLMIVGIAENGIVDWHCGKYSKAFRKSEIVMDCCGKGNCFIDIAKAEGIDLEALLRNMQ